MKHQDNNNHNPRVGGSSPSPATKAFLGLFKSFEIALYADHRSTVEVYTVIGLSGAFRLFDIIQSPRCEQWFPILEFHQHSAHKFPVPLQQKYIRV